MNEPSKDLARTRESASSVAEFFVNMTEGRDQDKPVTMLQLASDLVKHARAKAKEELKLAGAGGV